MGKAQLLPIVHFHPDVLVVAPLLLVKQIELSLVPILTVVVTENLKLHKVLIDLNEYNFTKFETSLNSV